MVLANAGESRAVALFRRAQESVTLILAFLLENIMEFYVYADERTMNERRENDRLLCADLVQVIWTDESDREHRRVANLEDISASGICIQMECSLPVGTEIKVRYSDGQLVGMVRYCFIKQLGYLLGVEFNDGCVWSALRFTPEHLLDPRDLGTRPKAS